MMDISGSTKVLFDRIQKLDPENVSKIMGYLLLQDNADEEIILLAKAPDHFLEKVVYKAKTELQRLPDKWSIATISPPLNPPRVFSHPPADSPGVLVPLRSFHVPSPFWDPQRGRNAKSASGYMNSNKEYQNQRQLYGSEKSKRTGEDKMFGFPNDYYYPDTATGNLNGSGHRRVPSMSGFPVICHLFHKGFCKHGNNCPYDHEDVITESSSQIVTASQKIFLTFPAESTFTEEDVFNYFSTFGPVKDVMIPCKQKRVFGFVTFANSDTVESVFQIGKPHFVQGSIVHVKRHRDELKIVDSSQELHLPDGPFGSPLQ
ncbi:Zinc finger CCCH domain-containing protein 18 [Quillaja saponaria]|uniref:Zinc finger CCCH domain-containing protein 18 n=1 Tax=Quillaja saponaria TaxID=32244 RepID=A0AAD7LST7_QUISA|nr:Zinc finger CCCH domain-containing protein 18 [Quillaja saponaria]